MAGRLLQIAPLDEESAQRLMAFTAVGSDAQGQTVIVDRFVEFALARQGVP